MCDRCGCVFFAPCFVDDNDECILLCKECASLKNAKINKEIVDMSWARAVSEWNKGQIWKDDLYGIPKKGGEYYADVKEMMEDSTHKKTVDKMMGKNEKPAKEPMKNKSFTQSEYAEILREYRKLLAEEDAVLIEEGKANQKIKKRHEAWMNKEPNDNETLALITQMIRKDFPDFKVLSKKEEKETQKSAPVKKEKEVKSFDDFFEMIKDFIAKKELIAFERNRIDDIEYEYRSRMDDDGYAYSVFKRKWTEDGVKATPFTKEELNKLATVKLETPNKTASILHAYIVDDDEKPSIDTEVGIRKDNLKKVSSLPGTIVRNEKTKQPVLFYTPASAIYKSDTTVGIIKGDSYIEFTGGANITIRKIQQTGNDMSIKIGKGTKSLLKSTDDKNLSMYLKRTGLNDA